MSPTVGSLFSGIGGLDLGLERAGFRVAWQVEVDAYCRRVLSRHWPDVPQLVDVRDVGPEVATVDCIAGGFPCQDVSDAGKRAGIDGERSGLWAEMARIVRMVRPRIVIVENVAALRHRGLGRVLGDLAACGYDAAWDCIPAASVGAPHIRDRIFILAYPKGQRRQLWSAAGQRSRRPAGGCVDMADADRHGAAGRGLGQMGGAPGAHAGEARQRQRIWDAAVDRGAAVADAGRPGLEVWEGAESVAQFAASVGARQWAIEPGVGRVADGIPHRVDRLRGLGNAVVPQVAEYVGRIALRILREADGIG